MSKVKRVKDGSGEARKKKKMEYEEEEKKIKKSIERWPRQTDSTALVRNSWRRRRRQDTDRIKTECQAP